MSVSVVVPCHNEAKYIEQCIKSIVEQSDYNSIRDILVVDDGSTDESPQILKQLKLKSNKLKILFDKNTLEFKGWETKDAYSNSVSFLISNLKTNNQIVDGFFKIPKEEDL